MKYPGLRINGMVGYTYDIDGVIIPKDWTIKGFITNYGSLLSVNSTSIFGAFSFNNYLTKEEVKRMIKNHERKLKLKNLEQ